MKTITYSTYTIAELREQFPEGYKRALREWQEREAMAEGIPWQEETIESLKECIKAAGLTLRNWSLGAYNRGNSVTLDSFHGEELTGKRAFAWLENNLFASLRIPFAGAERWKLSGYGAAYRAGQIRPCPFTGFYADDVYLASLAKAVRKGDTLKEAFEGLASDCAEMLEADAMDQLSEEYFFEHMQANEREFTEEGERD